MKLKSKSIIAVLYLVGCFSFITNNVVETFAEDIENPEVIFAIKTKNPIAGSPIELEINGIDKNAEFYWYSNNEQVGFGDTYIPTARDYESFIKVEAKLNGSIIESDQIYFSPLPVVYINTEDEKPVETRDAYKNAHMFIQGNIDHESCYDGGIEIKGRGTSSWHYSKKPYKIKLNKKTNLFGFGESKHYVLLANYLDISCLRNTIGYRFSQNLGLTAAQTEWVDVVFNGEFAGNYQLAQHIRVEENMVNITNWERIASSAAKKLYKTYTTDFPDGLSDLENEMKQNLAWITQNNFTYQKTGKTYDISKVFDIPTDISGGYLFEISNSTENDPSYFKTNKGIMIGVNKPEYVSTNTEMFSFIKDYLNGLEEALYSYTGYNGLGKSFVEYVDIDKFVNYWLTMELLGNEDASQRSRYGYMDVGGKLIFGPAWDFDISSHSIRSVTSPTNWAVTASATDLVNGQEIFKEVVSNPYFVIKAQERYWQIRDYYENLYKEDGIIDTYTEKIYESGIANEMLWNNAGQFSDRAFSGTAGDVSVYKNYLKTRNGWMDKNFDTEDSIITALNFPRQTHQYKRSSSIKVTALNCSLDKKEHGANYVWNGTTNIYLLLNSKILSNSKIYINGILYENPQLNERSEVIIPKELLNEGPGKKNVINIVVSSTERNFITIREEGDLPFEYTDFTGSKKCNTGEHELVLIKERTKDKNHYGIEECYYCNKCHHYFSIGSDKQQLRTKDVLHSIIEQNIPIKKEKNKSKVWITISIIVVIGTALGTLIPIIILKKKR